MNKELTKLCTLMNSTTPCKKHVTKSYRKGRIYRVQQVYDRNGFVIKQIIHKEY